MFISGFALAISQHKKNEVCHFNRRFRVSVPQTFLIVLPPTFLCGSGGNVTLLTQSVTFGSR